MKLARPKIDSATERKVRKQLAKGIGILKVTRDRDWHGAAHLKGVVLPNKGGSHCV